MVHLMPLLHIQVIMLFLLLFVTSASSQSLTSPTASDLQAFTQSYPHSGTVAAGGEVLYPFQLRRPDINWLSLILTVTSGDADLVVYSRVGTTIVSWTSAAAGNDRVDILDTDPQLTDGKRLSRNWEVAVVGYQTSQFRFDIKLGSGAPVLASDFNSANETVTVFSTQIGEFENSESQDPGTSTVSLMILANVVVLAAAGMCALRMRKAATNDGYLHLLSA